MRRSGERKSISPENDQHRNDEPLLAPTSDALSLEMASQRNQVPSIETSFVEGISSFGPRFPGPPNSPCRMAGIFVFSTSAGDL
jgi:hypothetical protein